MQDFLGLTEAVKLIKELIKNYFIIIDKIHSNCENSKTIEKYKRKC